MLEPFVLEYDNSANPGLVTVLFTDVIGMIAKGHGIAGALDPSTGTITPSVMKDVLYGGPVRIARIDYIAQNDPANQFIQEFDYLEANIDASKETRNLLPEVGAARAASNDNNVIPLNFSKNPLSISITSCFKLVVYDNEIVRLVFTPVNAGPSASLSKPQDFMYNSGIQPIR